MLLNFWGNSYTEEISIIKDAYHDFAKDNRVTFISINLDGETTVLHEYVKENGMLWTQGFLSKWWTDETKFPKVYSTTGIPSTYLISPEGKIAAAHLCGEKIKSAIQEALTNTF